MTLSKKDKAGLRKLGMVETERGFEHPVVADGMYWVLWNTDLEQVAWWTEGLDEKQHANGEDYPITFTSKRAALAYNKEFIKDQHAAVAAGDMDEQYDDDDVPRRVKVTMQGRVWLFVDDDPEAVSIQQLRHDAGRYEPEPTMNESKLSVDAFVASGTACKDLGVPMDDEGLIGIPGRVYAEHYYIIKGTDRRWTLIIGQLEHVSGNLAVLEGILYQYYLDA